MGLCGFVWVCVGLRGFAWVCVGLCGFVCDAPLLPALSSHSIEPFASSAPLRSSCGSRSPASSAPPAASKRRDPLLLISGSTSRRRRPPGGHRPRRGRAAPRAAHLVIGFSSGGRGRGPPAPGAPPPPPWQPPAPRPASPFVAERGAPGRQTRPSLHGPSESDCMLRYLHGCNRAHVRHAGARAGAGAAARAGPMCGVV